MLVTTYQHDFVPPTTRRYDFLRRKAQIGGSAEGAPEDAVDEGQREECVCIEEQKVEPPRAVQDQCAAAEWTGIAPMGKLINPRIIPTRFSPEQNEALANAREDDCFKMQPNRFLKILRTAYPDLYARLKQMPKDELNRRLEKNRLFTTYQIDFCDVDEYPEGIYNSMKKEDKKGVNPFDQMVKQGPCSEFRANVMQDLENEQADGLLDPTDPCEKVYKPFKISFIDSSRFVASGNSSHWRANIGRKRANFSEYMDTINKNGCVIMRNNIHDHSKCASGKHCRHALVHNCAHMK